MHRYLRSGYGPSIGADEFPAASDAPLLQLDPAGMRAAQAAAQAATAQAARPLLRLDPAGLRAERAAREAAELAKHPLLRLDPARLRAEQAARAAAEKARKHAESIARLAVIAISPAAIVFTAPDNTSAIATTLPYGTPVAILDRRVAQEQLWCRIGLNMKLGRWDVFSNGDQSPLGWLPCLWLAARFP